MTEKENLKNNNRGITLVALVVTIVILLILAGITLTYVFGDNGIIKLAQKAKNETEAGMQKEQDELENLANMLKDEYGNNEGDNNGGNGDNTTNPPTGPDNPNPPEEDKTVADVVDKIQTENKTVEDSNGNKITIPGGFKVVPNSPEGTDASKKVDYTYNGDGTPAVQDGIVVEDEEGNQFVWIPVGEIKNKDGTTTTITLGRYTFDTTNGTPTLQQDSANYSQTVTVSGYGGNYYQELTSNSGNTAAKNLGDFVTKTKTNGGYYLGRYEASQGSDGKVDSQANKVAWNSITQPNAATAAREMYSSSYIESDLINSYSWDTTIVFIQNYSGNSNYAYRPDFVETEQTSTGQSGDKACNVYDLSSNSSEYCTEHSTLGNAPCVNRGGDSFVTSLSNGKTAQRYYKQETYRYGGIAFRMLLYLK